MQWRAKTTKNEINDGLNSSFKFPPYIRDLLDTPEVQRMSEVGQLGFSPYVYPNATHTRKPHLIGTARNALEMWDAIIKNGPANIGDYSKLVGSAALLHDIGHAPKAHGLEKLIHHFTKKSHEEVGAELITGEYSLLEFYKSLPEGFISENDRNSTIQALENIPPLPEVLGHFAISPEHVAQIIDPSRANKNSDLIGVHHVLREIISHSVLDADRLDYLQRDALMTGIKEGSFDPQQIIPNLGVILDDDGYHMAIEKGGLKSLNFALQARMNMFEIVYNHKHAIEPEAMIYEAFKRFLGSSQNNESYGRNIHLLTDGQFEAFFSWHCQDPVANMLMKKAKWDRRGRHKAAYKIKSRTMGRTLDENSESLQTLRAISNIEGDFPEDVIRDEILSRANAGRKKPFLDDHEIIVYQRPQKGLRTLKEFQDKFDLYVFSKKNNHDGLDFDKEKRFYHAGKALKEGSVKDTHLDMLFETFKSHQTSLYLLVSTPQQNILRVKQATIEYIKEITK